MNRVLRIVRTAACLTVALLLIGGLYVFSQTPRYPGDAVATSLSNTMRTGVALVEVHALGGDARLRGAREMLRLDPELEAVGRTGATILVSEAPAAERVQTARRVARQLEATDDLLAPVVDALAASDDMTDVRTAIDLLPEIAEAGARSTIAEAVVDRVTTERRAGLLRDIESLVDVLPDAVRARAADRIATREMADAAGGDWTTVTSVALGFARTPQVLNNRGAYVTDAEEKLALFTEAHELAPNDVIIAANLASVAKPAAIDDRDASRLAEYDAMLDAGLDLDPNAEAWARARGLRMPAQQAQRSSGCGA